MFMCFQCFLSLWAHSFVYNLICENWDLGFKIAFLQRRFVFGSVRSPRELSTQGHFIFCFMAWGLSHTSRINSGPKLSGMQFFLLHTPLYRVKTYRWVFFCKGGFSSSPNEDSLLKVLDLCISHQPQAWSPISLSIRRQFPTGGIRHCPQGKSQLQCACLSQWNHFSQYFWALTFPLIANSTKFWEIYAAACLGELGRTRYSCHKSSNTIRLWMCFINLKSVNFSGRYC